MTKLCVALALLIAAPLSAAAPPKPQWVSVQGQGRTVEVDRASLTWRSLQRAWWRTVHESPARNGVVEERHLELIDCGAGTTAVIQTVSLGADGTMLANAEDGESLALQRLSPPTPGTIGEAVAMTACRLRPPAPKPRRR